MDPKSRSGRQKSERYYTGEIKQKERSETPSNSSVTLNKDSLALLALNMEKGSQKPTGREQALTSKETVASVPQPQGSEFCQHLNETRRELEVASPPGPPDKSPGLPTPLFQPHGTWRKPAKPNLLTYGIVR